MPLSWLALLIFFHVVFNCTSGSAVNIVNFTVDHVQRELSFRRFYHFNDLRHIEPNSFAVRILKYKSKCSHKNASNPFSFILSCGNMHVKDEWIRLAAARPGRGSDCPPDSHSLPLPFESILFCFATQKTDPLGRFFLALMFNFNTNYMRVSFFKSYLHFEIILINIP